MTNLDDFLTSVVDSVKKSDNSLEKKAREFSNELSKIKPNSISPIVGSLSKVALLIENELRVTHDDIMKYVTGNR